MTNHESVGQFPAIGTWERAERVLGLLLDEAYPERLRRTGEEPLPEGGPATSYRKQPGLGPYRYTASVDASDLYDMMGDPLEFRANAAGETVAEAATSAERAVIDAGYIGYWVYDPWTGPVAVVFEALKVESVVTEH